MFGAIASLAGGLLGNRSNERIANQGYQNSLDAVRLGNNMDLRNQRLMYDHRLTRMKEYGLTPVEMFGSPASGPGGGTSGSGATLGNAASQQASAQMQNDQSMKNALLGAGIELQKTKMQTDAQKDVAETQANTATRGQDIDLHIAKQTLNLRRSELANKVRETEALIGKTEQETNRIKHEVLTSDPKFIMLMKQWQMGPANMLVQLAMDHHGISFQDENFKKMSYEERERIIDDILAMSSLVGREAAGGREAGSALVEGAKSTAQSIYQILESAAGNVNAWSERLGDMIPNLGSSPGQQIPSWSDRESTRNSSGAYP